ncbi:MAG: cobyric acid synthase [Pseudomonadota bacterium]
MMTLSDTPCAPGHSRPPAPCIAVLGTGSDVGKSVVATAICRVLADAGLTVAPYKAQNMSNNSGVTPEGLEMGRAQIVQAEAAGITPHVDMNPILLKPTSDVGAQVVLMGSVWGNQSARDYHTRKETLFAAAAGALDRLRARTDAVVMEGAGSCAEVNLMANDIVNFRMATYADAPVILVADIHRGGVFAQIVGTLACLPPAERDRVAGIVINRFRGDLSLFDDGVAWIAERTGKPVLGVLPWFADFAIEAEDSVVIEAPDRALGDPAAQPTIGVIRIPHISNFTDVQALKQVDGLAVHFLERPRNLAAYAAILMPGSKNTRYDLQWLHDTGWHREIRRYAAGGGHVLGICGGYQMMGVRVLDPQGLEGAPGETEGLGLLPVETVLKAPKTTTRTRFSWNGAHGEGYEIHMGETSPIGEAAPLFLVSDRNGALCERTDGCISDSGNVLGTYIHGMLDSGPVLGRWLESLALAGPVRIADDCGLAAREAAYRKLADHFRVHVDTAPIIDWAKGGRP